MNTIPKIIHQIWIGPHTPPSYMMSTWKIKHPDYEYILWTEAEVLKRGFIFETQAKIDIMPEYCGKSDLMRYEILYKYGGIFIDADSICINPFDDYFMVNPVFLTYENENVRKGLISNGTMGFIPKHPFMRDLIDWILTPESTPLIQQFRAWYSVGPVRLTELINKNKYKDISVFPSYCFLPHHFTGDKYLGHRKVYAYQEWGTAKQIYSDNNDINTIVVPDELLNPIIWVSVLIPSYNTDNKYIEECLESILRQCGNFGMEIVWMNDGSDQEHTEFLENALENVSMRGRFIKIVYIKTAKNNGVCDTLDRGVIECSYPLIFRMDSDDIMFPDRIQKQIDYMTKNPECVICGTGITMIKNSVKLGNKIHPLVQSWQDIKKQHFINNYNNDYPEWIINQPTVCFKKEAVISVGNYSDFNTTKYRLLEDYGLWLRLLKTYGNIHSMPDILLYYRIHPSQLTFDKSDQVVHKNKIRSQEIWDKLFDIQLPP
jgi:hypothetical protein